MEGTGARASARTRAVLSIAGSDSGGGAGVQADLKAFARNGVHGTCALTAVTAQNTTAVAAVHVLEPAMVLAQVDAVLGDIGVDAVKVGMLGTSALVRAVARALGELPADTPVVVDPVMVAESGAALLQADARQALVEELLPRASVLTPNLPEARVLAGRDPDRGEGDAKEAETLARVLLRMGPRCVVVTGGHTAGAHDVFVTAGTPVQAALISGDRHPDGAAHGSGCTHSATLAAQLALGRTPLEAARIARALTGDAIAHGLRDIGAGAGPVDVLDIATMPPPKPAPVVRLP